LITGSLRPSARTGQRLPSTSTLSGESVARPPHACIANMVACRILSLIDFLDFRPRADIPRPALVPGIIGNPRLPGAGGQFLESSALRSAQRVQVSRPAGHYGRRRAGRDRPLRHPQQLINPPHIQSSSSASLPACPSRAFNQLPASAADSIGIAGAAFRECYELWLRASASSEGQRRSSSACPIASGWQAVLQKLRHGLRDRQQVRQRNMPDP